MAALIGAVVIARAGGTAPSAAADTAKDKARKDMQQEEGCGGEQQYQMCIRDRHSGRHRRTMSEPME